MKHKSFGFLLLQLLSFYLLSILGMLRKGGTGGIDFFLEKRIWHDDCMEWEMLRMMWWKRNANDDDGGGDDADDDDGDADDEDEIFSWKGVRQLCNLWITFSSTFTKLFKKVS